jgi:hypothetical protein
VRLAILACVTLISSCGSTSPDQGKDPDLRILFIGNSLTYANDLPSMVQRLGRSNPDRPVTVASVAYGGFSLEDHWNRGDAQRAIASDHWDFVVLQQGPSALEESRKLLVDYVTRFTGDIRAAGGEPAVYMVWPGLSLEFEWDDVTANYASAASAVNGILLPAGEALRAARTSGIQLFDSDGFHPSQSGSYLAALVIYAELAGTSPIGLTRRAGVADVPAEQVTALENAAAAAIARFGPK